MKKFHLSLFIGLRLIPDWLSCCKTLHFYQPLLLHRATPGVQWRNKERNKVLRKPFFFFYVQVLQIVPDLFFSTWNTILFVLTEKQKHVFDIRKSLRNIYCPFPELLLAKGNVFGQFYLY